MTTKSRHLPWLPLSPLATAALAVLTLLSGCRAESPEAAFSRGQYARSLAIAHSLATDERPAALNLVGLHFYLGVGVARDFAAARYWFERAARLGDANAQRNLALLYLRGLGVRQNNFLAYAWFNAAAERGNPRAQPYLVVMGDALTPNQIVKARRALDGEIGQRVQD